MVRPLLQSRALLLREFVPLINPDDAGKRAANVVQNLFNNRETNTEPRHATGGSAAQVVHYPIGGTGQVVETNLVLAKAVQWRRGVQREHKPIAYPRQALKDGNGLRRQRHLVASVVLYALARE